MTPTDQSGPTDSADESFPETDDSLRTAADAGVDPDVMEFATRMFAMAREGRTAELNAYLDAGLPVDLTNTSGDSLIMLAAYRGHPETVRALLAHGADPDRLNDRGQSPLAGAVFKREVDVVRALLHGGADPRAGEPDAVSTAKMFDDSEISALLT